MKHTKKSQAEIRQEVDQRLREIAEQREKAERKGLQFAALTEEDLIRKISGETSNSPYFYMHGWSGGTPGDPTSVEIYISNPDPTVHTYLFVSVFFGVANFVGDIAMALAGRDTRWPLLTSPPFTMAAGTIVSQTFTYLVPPGIPSSTYLGNGVLWKANHLDQGVYFDRNLFNVAVI